MPKGVYIRTAWHREINRRSSTGRKQSALTAYRRSLSLRGRVRSSVEIQRAAASLRKHYQDHPDELMGKNNPFYGRKHSIETRTQLSEKRKTLWHNEGYRGKATDSILRGRRASCPFDSQLELHLSQALTDANMLFQYQISIDGPGSANYDFGVFIGSAIVYVEIAGCYWHGCPKCFGDIQKKLVDSQGKSARTIKSLKTQLKGYGKIIMKQKAHPCVLILWEHDVKENGYAWCVEQIKAKAACAIEEIKKWMQS